MIKTNMLLINILDDAFSKKGWQGPMNLINTVESLSFDQILFSSTIEGYSAWQIVLHCAYWKWVVADLLSEEKIDEFPRMPDDFPILPEIKNMDNWKNDYKLLIQLHEQVKVAVLNFPEERWMEIPKSSNEHTPYIKYVYGLAAHDVYHTAQIRNMGIK